MSKIVIDRKTLFALASETRIKILKKLDERRMTLAELSKSLNISKTTVKEHLDKLIDAGLIRRADESRKWVYYELTEKGKKILHPDSITKIILLLSTAIASMLVGFFELYRAIKPIKPTPIQTKTPVPAPIRPHVPVQTSPGVHPLVGLILITLGIALILYYVKKGRLII